MSAASTPDRFDAGLEISAIPLIGEIEPGAEIGELIAAAAADCGLEPRDGDVLVISQKVVSKAEGRLVSLSSVSPGQRAAELAARLGKDPRLVELILSESREVIRAAGGVLITETRAGWICANAGIDSSNVRGSDTVALLPEDADASARRIRAEIAARCGRSPGVLIADSFGRPWRIGQTEVAIGCAGVAVLDDWRGEGDSHGQRLAATAICAADELACAADLARSKTSRTPVVLVRGSQRWWTREDGPGAATLQRERSADLFR